MGLPVLFEGGETAAAAPMTPPPPPPAVAEFEIAQNKAPPAAVYRQQYSTALGGTHLIDFAVVDEGLPAGYILVEHAELALALLARLLLDILILVGHGVVV